MNAMTWRTPEQLPRRPRQLLVRYVSPFGSPAWMIPEAAQAHLAEDDARWLRYQAAEALSAEQRQTGPPRIERGQASR